MKNKLFLAVVIVLSIIGILYLSHLRIEAIVGG